MTEDRCEMRHTKPAKATGVFEGRAVCTRHLNRHLQDDRIREYVKRGPRCPTHPDREPGVTRWHGQATPFLYCPTPAGEKVYYKPTGKGIFRTPGGSTYTGWCEWKAEIPVFVVKGMDRDLLREIQVLRAVAELEDTGNHLGKVSAALGITGTSVAHARTNLVYGGYLEWQYFEESIGLLKRRMKTIAVTDRGRWLIDAARNLCGFCGEALAMECSLCPTRVCYDCAKMDRYGPGDPVCWKHQYDEEVGCPECHGVAEVDVGVGVLRCHVCNGRGMISVERLREWTAQPKYLPEEVS